MSNLKEKKLNESENISENIVMTIEIKYQNIIELITLDIKRISKRDKDDTE